LFYGRFSILPKGQGSALKATGGLITDFLAMLRSLCCRQMEKMAGQGFT